MTTRFPEAWRLLSGCGSGGWIQERLSMQADAVDDVRDRLASCFSRPRSEYSGRNNYLYYFFWGVHYYNYSLLMGPKTLF